jgi:hypothetical protein
MAALNVENLAKGRGKSQKINNVPQVYKERLNYETLLPHT